MFDKTTTGYGVFTGDLNELGRYADDDDDDVAHRKWTNSQLIRNDEAERDIQLNSITDQSLISLAPSRISR